jgi:hypothetical protein
MLAIMKDGSLDYDTYKAERELLAQLEQSNYENYEKTILTLSSAFLAFSLTFLSLTSNHSPGQLPNPPLSISILFSSWLCFGLSVIAILVDFLVGALAMRRDVQILERALKESVAARIPNPWVKIVYLLYFVGGVLFMIGVVLLITFCVLNVDRLG